MTALLLLTQIGCTKTKDADGTPKDSDTAAVDTEPVVETGTITGKAEYPGSGLTQQTKLLIGINDDLQIWTEPIYREVHDNPTLPFEYSFEAPVGTYFVGAYLDLTGDSAGGPNQGDPEGVARDETGPFQAVVVAGAVVEIPPIKMKVKTPE